MTERILDHVGVAVHSLDDALPTFGALANANGSGREVVETQGVEVIFVGSGAGRIELLAPTRPDSPVARFLERRGPGMHHLCYRVPDIARALEEHRATGYELIDTAPRPGAQGHRVAFLHPRSTGGVLIELLESEP
ncbi:MAG: methylmalonyl-CoA epimerase [Gemmatimonadota bacterium]|nr:methylmalonyl-CoA epimerase [Gemmatimonadota bacterium]